jgi:glycosyltransferase involved in cell wall biosynthesis
MGSGAGRQQAFPLARRSRARVVLQLTGMSSLKYGGLERYFVALAQKCNARGWQLILQYNEPPTSYRYIDDLHDAGAELVVRRLGPGRVAAAWRALVLIAQQRPRVVHLHHCGASTRLAVGLFAHHLGAALALQTKHSIPGGGSRAFAAPSYSHLDRILCVSRSVERGLVRLGVAPSKVTTHYLGVPDLGPLPEDTRVEVRRQFAIPKSSPVLVTVVFNDPMKGVDILIDAFIDSLSTSFPGLHLIVVGVAQDELVEASGRVNCLPDRIHWAGIRDDVRPYLAASDIYVQPSRTEGLGLAIVEAMRESLPVVATRVGGIPEAVADGTSGLLVEPGSPEALASAISTLLVDPDLAREYADAGNARWRRRFQLQDSVDALFERYYGPAA